MKKTYKIDKSRLYAQADYSAALNGGEISGYKLNRINLDAINLADGEVCFFDVYNTGACKPFAAHFCGGRYVPFAMLASTTHGSRVAMCGLDGGLSGAAVWKLAFTDLRDIIRLNANESVGTVIGSGFGALCGKNEYDKFVKAVKDSEDSFHPLDGVITADGGCCKLCDLKDFKLFVCNTGWGEGKYRSYLGIDAQGIVRGVICDFGMIDYGRASAVGEFEEFEIDVGAEELYVPDPKKSDAENTVIMYSSVIADADSDSVKFNAYSRRGYAYHIIGKYDEALGDYLQAIEIGKNSAEQTDFYMHAWSLYDNAASICCDMGKTEKAIELYTEAKSYCDSFYGGAYSGLIDIYRSGKLYEKALAVANEMVACRPKDPAAYIKRSEIYMECQDYEKAVADLDVLINVYKLNECILDKAMCLSYLNDNASALRTLDGYLLEGRANEIYYDLRADICMADNDISSAYNAARNAYDVNPDYPETLEKLITLDGLLLNFKNVVKWASRFIEARPLTAYGYLIRAEAYANLGEYESAAADCLYVVTKIDASPKNCGTLVKTALQGGEVMLAKKYTKLLRKTDDAYYIYAMGLMLFYRKKYARARRYLASALAINGDDGILASLAECFIACGDYDNAEVAIKKYAEVADGEAAFLKSAELAVKRDGAPRGGIFKEYVKRFLGGCTDGGLLEKAEKYFNQL